MINIPASLKHILGHSLFILLTKLTSCYRCFKVCLILIFRLLLFQVKPFWVSFTYFLALPSLGFLFLKASEPRTTSSLLVPKDVDLFFTSVSATTLSSLSTVEMEVFSNTQLAFLTVMMMFGGEVFVSVIGLLLKMVKMKQQERVVEFIIESQIRGFDFGGTSLSVSRGRIWPLEIAVETNSTVEGNQDGLITKSIRILTCVVIFYLLTIHVIGSIFVFVYFKISSSARQILVRKNLSLKTFAIFTTVSNFSNCGFIPTNENMMVFRKHTALLLIALPQLLLGNTLYPACLRLVIFYLEKVTGKAEFRYMLEDSGKLGYRHLLPIPRVHCVYQTITCLGFVILQLVVFCCLEWNSEASKGLDGFGQKLTGSLFQVVNTRHAGESVYDLSAISPAVLVLFVLMMYLPPYTTFLPQKMSSNEEGGEGNMIKKDFWGLILCSHLTYIIFFIFLICIIEAEKMKMDPLNFNVFAITVEVISAYGNVGLSLGYDCGKRLNTMGECKNASYGFVGRWSTSGKLLIIIVMLFGRLKKFSMGHGRAWLLV